MLRAADEQRKGVLRAADVVADLEDDKVPADEHVVEIVRVDLEQDRGHSTSHQRPLCSAGILVLALPPRLPRLLPVNDSGGGGEGAIERGARCEGGREGESGLSFRS